MPVIINLRTVYTKGYLTPLCEYIGPPVKREWMLFV